MPNYNQTDITGEKYTRCTAVKINNCLNGIPIATFKEEDVVTTDSGDTIIQKKGTIGDSLTDPNTEFDLLDPTDDSVVETVKYQDVYNILYSLYRHLVNIRDNS